MEISNTVDSKNQTIKEQLNSFDTLRSIFAPAWMSEIIFCLTGASLYFGELINQININQEIKLGNDKTQIDPRVLTDCLTVLQKNKIVEQVIINPKRITLGYALTAYGLEMIEKYFPMMDWAIIHHTIVFK